MSTPEIKNAVIKSATICDPERGLLSAYIDLDYGGSGQSFGGLALYLPESFKHHKLESQAGHFIWRCMEIAGVSKWGDLPGKTIRVRATHSNIEAIGHIVKDDWFFPAKDFVPGPELHHATSQLVDSFAIALKSKLSAAEKKYGYTDGWKQTAWMDECRAKLREHLDKGDPRDVAAYCAFLWHHGESTAIPGVPVVCDLCDELGNCTKAPGCAAGVPVAAAALDEFIAKAGRNGWMSDKGPEPRINLVRYAWDAALAAAGVAVTIAPDRVQRLQHAIEGECDGLAVDEQHARAILEYVDGVDLPAEANKKGGA
jgi:hypothetical protein